MSLPINKCKTETVIVRLDYNALLTSAGGQIKLAYPIYDAIGLRTKYFSVTRLSGAIDVGAIQLLHCDLASNAKEDGNFRVASSTDMFSAEAVQKSSVIGYTFDQSRTSGKMVHLACENPIIEFSSAKSISSFIFYVTNALLVPLVYPSPYIVEIVLEIFTSADQ